MSMTNLQRTRRNDSASFRFAHRPGIIVAGVVSIVNQFEHPFKKQYTRTMLRYYYLSALKHCIMNQLRMQLPDPGHPCALLPTKNFNLTASIDDSRLQDEISLAGL